MTLMNGRRISITRVATRLIICVVLAGCANSTQEITSLSPTPCAADRPTINIVHVDGHFIISDEDMGQLTGYMAALEAGCVAPKQAKDGVIKTTN